jgi:hypothetical protein
MIFEIEDSLLIHNDEISNGFVEGVKGYRIDDSCGYGDGIGAGIGSGCGTMDGEGGEHFNTPND